jgi:ACR3 family arsenite efflux pump ArsB
MMYPILCKVRFEALVEVFSHRGIWKQIGFSVFMNWIVAPFLMVRGLLFQYDYLTRPIFKEITAHDIMKRALTKLNHE